MLRVGVTKEQTAKGLYVVELLVMLARGGSPRVVCGSTPLLGRAPGTATLTLALRGVRMYGTVEGWKLHSSKLSLAESKQAPTTWPRVENGCVVSSEISPAINVL